jgi:hypothetical protein
VHRLHKVCRASSRPWPQRGRRSFHRRKQCGRYWAAEGAGARPLFFGREALETFFLAPLLVPEILLGAALYLFYARLAVQASIWTLLCAHLVICTP